MLHPIGSAVPQMMSTQLCLSATKMFKRQSHSGKIKTNQPTKTKQSPFPSSNPPIYTQNTHSSGRGPLSFCSYPCAPFVQTQLRGNCLVDIYFMYTLIHSILKERGFPPPLFSAVLFAFKFQSTLILHKPTGRQSGMQTGSSAHPPRAEGAHPLLSDECCRKGQASSWLLPFLGWGVPPSPSLMPKGAQEDCHL